MHKLSLIAVLFLHGCSTVDLRPDEPATDDDRRVGEKLLRQLADAHGGRSAWLAARVVRAKMSDRWKNGFLHLVGGPWPRNGTQFELTLLTGRDNGRLRFTDVDEPDWGIQNWRTYKVEHGEPVFKQHKKIAFWIPTTTYFVEAPFRVQEATTVYRMSPATVAGRSYERVFATWGDDAPQDKIDQYVVWIDAETHRLAWMKYTVRDYGDWMMGIMAYEDYVEVGGFTLARRMGTVDKPGGKRTLRQMTVETFEVEVDVPDEHVVPRPDLRGTKH